MAVELALPASLPARPVAAPALGGFGAAATDVARAWTATIGPARGTGANQVAEAAAEGSP